MDEQQQRPAGWRVSREVRPSELLLAASLVIGILVTWQQRDARIDQLEKGQAALVITTKEAQTTQAATNSELRTEIRQVGISISADIKELGKEVRDVRDRVNRARM